MATIHQHIVALFNDFDPDIRNVITRVLEFEQENINQERPRFKEDLLQILDHVERTSRKDTTDEN